MSEKIQTNIEELKSMPRDSSSIDKIEVLLNEIKNQTKNKATKEQLQEIIGFLDSQIKIFDLEPKKVNILNDFKADYENLISNYGQEKSDYNFSTASQISGIENKKVLVLEKYKVEIVENNSYLKIRNIESNVIGKLKKGEIVEIIGESVVFEGHKFLNIKSGDKQGFVAADYLVEQSADSSIPATTMTVKAIDTNKNNSPLDNNSSIAGGVPTDMTVGTVNTSKGNSTGDNNSSIAGGVPTDMTVGTVNTSKGNSPLDNNSSIAGGVSTNIAEENKPKLIHKENIKDKNGAILSGDFEKEADGKLHIINGTLAHTDGTGKVDIYEKGEKKDYTVEYMALMGAMVANDIASFTGIWTIPGVVIGTGYDAYDLTQKEDAGWQALKKMGLVDNRYYAGDKGILEYGLNVLGLIPGMTAATKLYKIQKFYKGLSGADKVKFDRIQSFVKDKFSGIGETAAKKGDIGLEYSKETNDLKKALEKAAKEKKSTEKPKTNGKTTEKAENVEGMKKNLGIGENLVKFTDNKYIGTTLDLFSKELALKGFGRDFINIPVNLIRQPLITIRQAIETLLKKESGKITLADGTKLEKTGQLFKIALFGKKEFTGTLDQLLSYAISLTMAYAAFNTATYTKEQLKESPAENLIDTIFNFLYNQHLWLPSMSRDLFMELFEGEK